MISQICVNQRAFHLRESAGNIFILLFISIILSSCNHSQTSSSKKNQTLYRVSKDSLYEYGSPAGYINEKGDTIIPIGKYLVCFTDTIQPIGFVLKGDLNGRNIPLAINTSDSILFEVYWFDNGPDYIAEGVFRIVNNGKVGFADSLGNIVIEPSFACAEPFQEGKARVSIDCEIKTTEDADGHRAMISDNWFYIDKGGNKLNP